MRALVGIFILGLSSSFAQQTDYNLKKGFAAEGYDVVAYFNNEAKEGNKEFIAEHDGVKYKFSSKENLNAFKKEADKYIPQYGGYCAYAIAVNSKKVSVNPKTFEIRDNKLYLFYNKLGNNTLKTWNKKGAKGLQQKADKNWEAVKFQ